MREEGIGCACLIANELAAELGIDRSTPDTLVRALEADPMCGSELLEIGEAAAG